MKNWVSTLIKIVITIAILAFLYYSVDFSFEELKKTLSSIKINYFLATLPGFIVVLGIKSLRWNILIRNEGTKYSTYKSFAAFMASDAIGIITPGRIGEISRLFFLRQESSISLFSALKTVIADRIYDFTVLLCLGFTGLFYYTNVFGEINLLYYFLITLAIGIISWIIIVKILIYLVAKTKAKDVQIVVLLRDAFLSVNSKKMLPNWIITFVAYLLYFFFSMMLMKALSIDISFLHVALIISIMSLSTVIPISVAGFGTREATLVILFAYYGLGATLAISFSLLHFLAFFVWGGLVGMVFWIFMPISLSEIKSDTKNVLLFLKFRKKTNEN